MVFSLITVKTKMKMEKPMKLKCPHCGGEVNIDSLLVQQFEGKGVYEFHSRDPVYVKLME